MRFTNVLLTDEEATLLHNGLTLLRAQAVKRDNKNTATRLERLDSLARKLRMATKLADLVASWR